MLAGARCAREANRIAHHVVGRRHAANQRLQLEDVGGSQHPLELRLVGRGRGGDDLLLFGLRRVVHEHVEHEAIELGLGQRIGPFELDRVLGRQHEEWQRQAERLTAGGDLFLLHGLEQRRLGLGRRPVDFVGQHDVGEHRPLDEPDQALAAAGVLFDDVRAGDVARHEVGGELDAVELEVQHPGEARDQQRLGESRHPDQQHVSVREQRGEKLVHHRILPHDHLAQLPEDALTSLLKGLDRLEIGGTCLLGHANLVQSGGRKPQERRGEPRPPEDARETSMRYPRHGAHLQRRVRARPRVAGVVLENAVS